MEPSLDLPHRRRGSDPSWSTLAARHWPQYVAVAVLAVALQVADAGEPVQRVMYAASDAEYWRYSYPFTPDAFPVWVVPLVSLVLPALVFLGAAAVGWVSRVEAHHSCLALLACVVTTGLLSNLAKNQVARYRPDFASRCWPTTHTPAFDAAGYPQCEEGVPHPTIKTGMRSFPSVHASWSASGLGFLSLWLAGKLRVFAGPVAPERLVASLLPLLGAAWIGVSRLQVYRHHVEDVCLAFLLGLLLACAFYRHIYAGITSRRAGCLTEQAAEEEEQAREVPPYQSGLLEEAAAASEPI